LKYDTKNKTTTAPNTLPLAVYAEVVKGKKVIVRRERMKIDGADGVVILMAILVLRMMRIEHCCNYNNNNRKEITGKSLFWCCCCC
jgi:hypothetical protein